MNLPLTTYNLIKNLLALTFFAFYLCFSPIAQAAPGDLDTSFGNGGKVVTDINNLYNFANAVAIQPDGKIVIGGGVNGTTQDFALARYLTNGSLDGTFGNGGIVVTDINGAGEQVTALAIQGNGKIVALGENNSATFNGFVLARYNIDGTLDNTFGTSGKVSTSFGSGTHFGKSMVIQSDGKILAAGSARNNLNQFAFTLARYNPNGTLDNTFGTGGKVSIALGVSANQNDQAQAVNLQGDGKIVVAGNSNNIGDFGVVRLNPDGSPDASFGTGGKVTTDINGNDLANHVSIQTDGKIIVSGASNAGGSFSLVRYNINGTLDNTFGNGGKVITIVGVSGSSSSASSIQPDGKIIACGQSGIFPDRDFALVRYNSNGSIDTTFGVNGIVVTQIGNSTFDPANAMALQRDGRVIVVGGTGPAANTSISDFAVVRYLNNTFAQKTPFDFDGDSKTDISIFRPSVGEWWYSRSSDSGNAALQFGNSNDKLTPADFTGDGKTDIAFWRPVSGEWFILRSEDNSFFSFPFGTSGDIPAPADYDGDGKSDAAVYRPSAGTWFILNSGGSGTTIRSFGIAEDKPVPADYDGDGKADIAIFRPSVSEWWLLRSTAGLIAAQFGQNGDKAVPGDFTGDGKADIAFWRPADGFWYILRSEDGSFFSFPFGASGDIPVAGDYDGDGKADAAVFRPSNSTWFASRSTAGILIATFGTSGDIPVPGVFVP